MTPAVMRSLYRSGVRGVKGPRCDVRAALLLDEDRPGNVRDYTAKHGIAEETAAIAQGLREKAKEFRKSGGEIHQPASLATRQLTAFQAVAHFPARQGGPCVDGLVLSLDAGDPDEPAHRDQNPERSSAHCAEIIEKPAVLKHFSEALACIARRDRLRMRQRE